MDGENVSSLMGWHKSFWFHEPAALGQIFGWIIPPVTQGEGGNVKIWEKKIAFMDLAYGHLTK